MDRAAFADALRALSVRYWDRHPFHIRMHGGALSEADVRSWVANRWYYQKILPLKNAAIIANCPDQDVRRRWLARIAFQDGTAVTNGTGANGTGANGTGANEIGAAGGLADWLALGGAVGLSREEILDERHVLPGVRFAVDAYLAFARTRPWLEAVAAALTELFSPDLMRDRVAVFRSLYPWIGARGGDYFESRIGEVTGDCAYTLDLVLSRCVTAEQQQAALAALAFKCDVLWAILDAIEHAAYRRERAAALEAA